MQATTTRGFGRSSSARLLYFVPADALSHSHIHALKVRALRAAGVLAERVIVCSGRAASKAREIRDPQDGRAISVRPDRLAGARMALHVLSALREGDVIAQALRVAPLPVHVIRALAARMGRRFRSVLELEGDVRFESDYLRKHPYREGFYDAVLRRSESNARRQFEQAALADGLVLMSQEHVDVWAERLGRQPRAVAVPALFDPVTMRFDAAERASIRSDLGLDGRTVLAYAGNVLCSWQRFGCLCRLVGRLASEIHDLSLMAIVPPSDHAIAAGFIAGSGIGERTHLLGTQADRVNALLSAADIGVFLRADHPMNRIVTSAKLGEYVACGLPVITTGIGALYHDFLREQGAGFFTDPDADGADVTASAVLELRRRGADPAERARMADRARAKFTGATGPIAAYVDFVKAMLP